MYVLVTCRIANVYLELVKYSVGIHHKYNNKKHVQLQGVGPIVEISSVFIGGLSIQRRSFLQFSTISLHMYCGRRHTVLWEVNLCNKQH